MPDRTRKPYSRPETRPIGSNGNWLHDKAPTAPRADLKASAPSSKLLVSNLHYEITPKDLIAIFGQMGTLIREPLIRYDRSGRSSGVAVIFFETPGEATKARKQFDGILAKGQPISIVYDNSPPPAPRGARRMSSAPSSLLHRIQRAPLLDRLTKDHPLVNSPSETGGNGPIRTRTRGTGATRKTPKTAEELDKELDAFMGDGSDVAAPRGLAPVKAADVDMV